MMVVVLAGGLMLVLTRLRPAVVAAGMGAILGVLAAPSLALLGGLVAGAATLIRRVRRRRVRRAEDAADLELLCELTAIGLTGGLGVRPALALAVELVGGRLGTEIADRLRLARVTGLAEAMTSAGGLGRRLYVALGRAAATGASTLDQISQLADDLHAELVAARAERVRKKPVAMLFPLTLLILPGFLLLTVAPAVVDAFARLSI